MNDKYILVNGEPVLEPDVAKWGKWFENSKQERIVAKTKLPHGVKVSTVFLSLNHSFGEGPPLIYETMVFGGPHDGYEDRCSTREQAHKMHQRMVDKVKGLK